MRSRMLTGMASATAGFVALVWTLGALPVAPSPVGCAHAGFFGKVKGKQETQKNDAGSAPSSSDKQQSGGFFKQVKTNKPTPAPSPSASPETEGDGFSRVRERPRVIITPGAEDESRIRYPGRRTDGWRPSDGAFGGIKSPPKSGWNSRGYFEQLRRELERRRHAHIWYYPYDYGYYYWQRYHAIPWWVGPYYYAAYPTTYYYYAAPPTIIVAEPDDWVRGETYIPYITWPCDSLQQARDDIELAWRHERMELLERHLDPDHSISSYLRDEYTHSLSAQEFRELTLDAFTSIRTVSFDLNSVRYVSSAYWARLNGRHTFYDPLDNRTTVYVSYLLRRVEYDPGGWRWVIWEVRQSPHAD